MATRTVLIRASTLPARTTARKVKQKNMVLCVLIVSAPRQHSCGDALGAPEIDENLARSCQGYNLAAHRWRTQKPSSRPLQCASAQHSPVASLWHEVLLSYFLHTSFTTFITGLMSIHSWFSIRMNLPPSSLRL